jgi:hypothetical protein
LRFGNAALTPGDLVAGRSGSMFPTPAVDSRRPNRDIAMKSTLLVTAIALAAAVFAAAAPAQTGRPSAVEVPAAADAPRAIAADQELGSYGRYLMLNGATRETALAAARNVDHPLARDRVVATRARAGAAATAPAAR